MVMVALVMVVARRYGDGSTSDGGGVVVFPANASRKKVW